MLYDICCIGHITLDKVVTENETVFMPGGTSFYFSNAMAHMDVRYLLVTAVAEREMDSVRTLQDRSIEVISLPTRHTVYFENIYSSNQDHRTQRVLQQANPFSVEQVREVEARIFHLGPLLAGDIPVDLIKALAAKGKLSLDVQGFLRKVENYNVTAVDWMDKKEALPYIDYLKANEYEMEVLTGHSDLSKGAKVLAEWGVKELIVTLGSKGAVIYKEGVFYTIPAYGPLRVADATGCGDTYMAGYLYQRLKGAGIQQAGEFAAAMATLKIESSGPFTGTEEDVYAALNSRVRVEAEA
jgi:sugar/nucleoside kinase (ribokinase family)